MPRLSPDDDSVATYDPDACVATTHWGTAATPVASGIGKVVMALVGLEGPEDAHALIFAPSDAELDETHDLAMC